MIRNNGTLPLFDRAPAFFAMDPPKLRPYQTRAIQTLRDRVREKKTKLCLVAPTGCHAAGQLVMMFDGTIKPVERVAVGDLLMGPGGSRRRVISTVRGFGKMYRIAPIKGEPWIVNEDHVLTLVRTNADKQPWREGELVDVTVREWLTWSKWRKHIHKLIRSSVDFSRSPEFPVDPYFLGVYLGDGWIAKTYIGIAIGRDPDLEQYLISHSEKLGLRIRKDSTRGETNVVYFICSKFGEPYSNVIVSGLRELGLLRARSGNKFIPKKYLTARAEDRLAILAGLMDTDGSLDKKTSYDFVSKSKQLVDDVTFLARSVGLSAYPKRCQKSCQNGFVGNYWRVCISGETWKIPCIVARKKSPKLTRQKDVLRVGFSVSRAKNAKYYGFELNEDGRYLLGDFTVTHNSGKMTTIAALIRTSSVPVLFVCHLQELIDQCVKELRKVGVTNVGVIRGDDDRTNPTALVQVASIQTLARRDKPLAGIVFIDECHRAVSDSYLKLIEHYQDSIIIGFTATPVRLDGRPMGNVFECLDVVVTYEQLIKDGYIAAPLCYGAPVQPDLSRVKMSGSDFDEDSLGEVMRDQSLIGGSLDHWKKLANLYKGEHGGVVEGPYRRTLIFAVGIQHSLDVRNRFASAGVRIEHLDGNTPTPLRKAIIKALGDGELDAITSVGILLEGTDIPSAKCALHLRPTQSLTLARQSVGRILRPWHPGCPQGCRAHPSIEPLLLDHAGNIQRHGFPHEDLHWSLTERARPIEKKIATRLCASCYAYLPAYKRLCPYCGADSPPPKEQELPKESEQQLALLASTPEEMRKLYFRMIVDIARTKGYKPGFASARYKQRYGTWPPYEWSAWVKDSFSRDPVWLAASAVQAEKKAKHAAKKQAKELEKIEGAAPEDE